MADQVKNNALFFYQMLFPMYMPDKADVKNNTHLLYFSLVTAYMNVYAGVSGIGSGVWTQLECHKHTQIGERDCGDHLPWFARLQTSDPWVKVET
jgi:hypothetical protein